MNEANAYDTGKPNATRPAGGASQTSIQSSPCGEPRYFRNVAELGVQIGEALAYAHGQGLVHRDIKPSNLMLDARGTVWITDFGLAKTDESSDLTNPGEIVGTLRYMAPEQLDGKADARSDLYALGITLYELATLRPAFEDPLRARLFDQIRSQDPPRPRQLEPRVPRDLETILLKAIAKEPHRRYQTAAGSSRTCAAFWRIVRCWRGERAGWSIAGNGAGATAAWPVCSRASLYCLSAARPVRSSRRSFFKKRKTRPKKTRTAPRSPRRMRARSSGKRNSRKPMR